MRGCQAPRSPFRNGAGGEAHARTKVRAWERRFVPAKRLAGVGKRLVRIAKRLAAVTKPLAWVAKRLAAIGKSLASVGMEGAGATMRQKRHNPQLFITFDAIIYPKRSAK